MSRDRLATIAKAADYLLEATSDLQSLASKERKLFEILQQLFGKKFAGFSAELTAIADIKDIFKHYGSEEKMLPKKNEIILGALVALREHAKAFFVKSTQPKYWLFPPLVELTYIDLTDSDKPQYVIKERAAYSPFKNESSIAFYAQEIISTYQKYAKAEKLTDQYLLECYDNYKTQQVNSKVSVKPSL